MTEPIKNRQRVRVVSQESEFYDQIGIVLQSDPMFGATRAEARRWIYLVSFQGKGDQARTKWLEDSQIRVKPRLGIIHRRP